MRHVWKGFRFAGGSQPLPVGTAGGKKESLSASAEDGYLIEQIDETVIVTLGAYNRRTGRVTIGPKSAWAAVPVARIGAFTPFDDEPSPSHAPNGADEMPDLRSATGKARKASGGKTLATE